MTISRTRKVISSAALGVTAAMPLAPAMMSTAQAADVSVTGATATVTNRANGDKVASGDIVSFAVNNISIPNGAAAGDTFDITVPDGLEAFSSGSVNLVDSSGAVVGTLAQKDSKTYTVTLSDYVTSHTNVTASVKFNARVDTQDTVATEWPADSSKAMDLTVAGVAAPTGTSLTRIVQKPGNQNAIVQTDRNNEPSFDYLQAFVTKDNQLYQGQKGIAGPYHQVLTAPAGTTFDCDYNKTSLEAVGFNYDGTPNGASVVAKQLVTVNSCSDTTLDITVPMLQANGQNVDYMQWRPLLKLTPAAYAAKQDPFTGGTVHTDALNTDGSAFSSDTTADGTYIYPDGGGAGQFAPNIALKAYIDDANPAAPTGKTADGQDSDANSAPGVNAKSGDQTISVSVTNKGYGALTNVPVTDGSGKTIGTIDTLAAGETKTITTTVNVVGTFPNAKAYADTFTATATGGGETVTSADPVNANVAGVAAQPAAANDSFDTAYNTPSTVDVTANDTLGNTGDTWKSVALDGAAADGSVTTDQGKFTVDGTKVTFTPKDGFSGAVPAIGYTATDSNGNTAKATIGGTVEANPIQKPTASPDTATTDFGKAVTVDVSANDKFGQAGDNWTGIKLDGAAADGSVTTDQGKFTVSGTNVTFTPAAGYTGTTPAIGYTITDNHGNSASSTLAITVNDASAPSASPDTFNTPFGKAVTIDVSANDKVTQDGATWKSVALDSTTTDQGTFSVDGTKVTFTPKAGFSGAVPAVGYTITDSNGKVAKSTIAGNVGDAGTPTANDDTFQTNCNAPVTFNPLANDVLAQEGATWASLTFDGKDTLTVDAGTFKVNADNSVTFTPKAGVCGPVPAVTYTATDSNGKTATGKISGNVDALKPTANPDKVTTDYGKPVTADVATNDKVGNDGDTFTKVVAGPSDKGTVTVDGTKVTFTPADGVTGDVTIPYTITDNHGNTASSTLTVTVGAKPIAKPTANPDTANTDYGKPVTVNVTGNDTLGNTGDTWTKVIAGPTDKGTITVNGDNTVTFTPADGVTGDVTIPYTATDSNGNTASSTITVHVGDKPAPVKADPKAADDEVTTKPSTAVTVDVAANDTLGNTGDTWTKVEVGATDKGKVTVDGTKVTFTPADGVTGKVTLPYTITDSNGKTATANIDVNVEKPADTTPVTTTPVTTTPVTTTPVTTKPVTGPTVQTDYTGHSDDSSDSLLMEAAGLVTMLGLGGVASVKRRKGLGNN